MEENKEKGKKFLKVAVPYAIGFVVVILAVLFLSNKIDAVSNRLGKVETWTQDAAKFMNGLDGRLGKLEKGYAESATAVSAITNKAVELGQINELVSQLEAQRDDFVNMRAGVPAGIGGDGLADRIKKYKEETAKLKLAQFEMCMAEHCPIDASNATQRLFERFCHGEIFAVAPSRTATPVAPAPVVASAPAADNTPLPVRNASGHDLLTPPPLRRNIIVVTIPDDSWAEETSEGNLLISRPTAVVAPPPPAAEDFDVEVIPPPPAE
jgi:hypothetical protein